MLEIVGIVRQVECAWILGADFNMEPDTLQSHSLYKELKGLVSGT